jgi:hypothetical protein
MEEITKEERIVKNLEKMVISKLGLYAKPSQIRALLRSGMVEITQRGAVKEKKNERRNATKASNEEFNEIVV